MPRRNKAKRNRRIRVQLPELFTTCDSHGKPISIDERRWKSASSLPDWAPRELRPSTKQYKHASDKIADINYQAYVRSKQTIKYNDVGWKHYRNTTPSKTKRMYHPLKGLKTTQSVATLEPTIRFTTSWLEPVVDESTMDGEFEQHMKHCIPEVRTLLRTNRKKQKDWSKKCNEYLNTGKRRRDRNKPQKWMTRADCTVKIDKIQNWLEKHNENTLAVAMKEETRQARQKGKRKGGRTRGKKKMKTKQQRSHYLGNGSKHEMGWFQDTAAQTAHETLLMERLQMLEDKHKADKRLHCRRWRNTASTLLVPKSFVPLENTGIISGGKRFTQRSNGRKSKNVVRSNRQRRLLSKSNKYISPLLLPHEMP